MKPTTFSPCSATMPMQLRCRRQRRKSSSVQEYSKLSCSICKTSGMSRRIIQRICTRACSFSVRPVLMPDSPLPSPGSTALCSRVRHAPALPAVHLPIETDSDTTINGPAGCCGSYLPCSLASAPLSDISNALFLAQGQAQRMFTAGKFVMLTVPWKKTGESFPRVQQPSWL